ARAGIVGDLVPMIVDVDIRGNGAVKIAEVIEAMTDAEMPHRAVRVALGAWNGEEIASPLDLARVRKHREPTTSEERALDHDAAAERIERLEADGGGA